MIALPRVHKADLTGIGAAEFGIAGNSKPSSQSTGCYVDSID